MKSRLALLLTLPLLSLARAEEARFFRISGPVTSTITAFSANGYVTWTNIPTNATFTVQTAVSLVGPSNWVDYIQVPVTNPTTTHRLYDPNPPAGMALIPAGGFTMGATTNMGHEGYPDDTPQHSVYVSAFYMDKYEVTKALWDDVYNWAITHGYSFDFGAQGKASNHPAQSMTWYDAAKWCNARSEKEGRTPAYYASAAQQTVYRSGQVNLFYVNLYNSSVQWNNGYRLPTEAEWEKAARGGAIGHRFPWGNTITHMQANYYSYWSGGVPNPSYDVNLTSGSNPMFSGVSPYTSPVGYFSANGYGLYDMSGNVREWCWDWSGTYSSGSQTDPRGSVSGSCRVDRGGRWSQDAIECRAADRNCSPPTYRDFSKGFRSVLPAGQ